MNILHLKKITMAVKKLHLIAPLASQIFGGHVKIEHHLPPWQVPSKRGLTPDYLGKTKVNKITNLSDVIWTNFIFSNVHFGVLIHFSPDQMISQTCVIALIKGLESGIKKNKTFPKISSSKYDIWPKSPG